MQQQFLPVGCKFQPEDIELVAVYLSNRVANGPSTTPPFIYEYDLYGAEEPWKVWARFRPMYEQMFYPGTIHSDSDLYFFTKLKKKDPENKRFVRHVGPPGEGTWNANCTGKKILGLDGRQVIGVLKTFNYKNEKSEKQGNWIMHEYSLCENNSENVVLCRLRRKMGPSIVAKGTRSANSINQCSTRVADNNEVVGPIHDNTEMDWNEDMISQLMNEIDTQTLNLPTLTNASVLDQLGSN